MLETVPIRHVEWGMVMISAYGPLLGTTMPCSDSELSVLMTAAPLALSLGGKECSLSGEKRTAASEVMADAQKRPRREAVHLRLREGITADTACSPWLQTDPLSPLQISTTPRGSVWMETPIVCCRPAP